MPHFKSISGMVTFKTILRSYQSYSLICQRESLNWQSTTHVCPTYQTTVTQRLLIVSTEAEQAKEKMDRLATSTHFARRGIVFF